MANEFNPNQAKELLNEGISQAQELMKDPSKILSLLKDFEKQCESLPLAGPTIARIPVMISMVKAYITKEYSEVSPKVIATLVAAFIYVVKKKDVIPDNIPIVGFADDIAVIALALKLCEPELNAYQAQKTS